MHKHGFVISILLPSQTRRSMVFAKHLRIIGDDFRAKYLNSTDDKDHTMYKEDWRLMRVTAQSFFYVYFFLSYPIICV